MKEFIKIFATILMMFSCYIVGCFAAKIPIFTGSIFDVICAFTAGMLILIIFALIFAGIYELISTLFK